MQHFILVFTVYQSVRSRISCLQTVNITLFSLNNCSKHIGPKSQCFLKVKDDLSYVMIFQQVRLNVPKM